MSGRHAPADTASSTTIHTLPDDEFVAAMDARFGGIPDTIRNEPDLLAMFLPVLRADVTAYETYRRISSRRIECPTSVFGGEDDTRPTPAELAGWADVVASPITVETFTGGHFYINEQGRALTSRIATAWNAASVGR